MLLVVPAADCELIVAAAELGSRDTRLSQPNRTGRLVGISLIKLYSNEVTGLSRTSPVWWRHRGDALARQRNGNRSTRLEYKAHLLLTVIRLIYCQSLCTIPSKTERLA
jgi:hypothetical protein